MKGCIRRQWAVAHLKNRPLTLAEGTFMGLCREAGMEFAHRPVAKKKET